MSKKNSKTTILKKYESKVITFTQIATFQKKKMLIYLALTFVCIRKRSLILLWLI